MINIVAVIRTNIPKETIIIPNFFKNAVSIKSPLDFETLDVV